MNDPAKQALNSSHSMQLMSAVLQAVTVATAGLVSLVLFRVFGILHDVGVALGLIGLMAAASATVGPVGLVSLLRTLRSMSSHLQAISTGDLSAELTVKGEFETAAVAEGLRQATTCLRSMVQGVDRAAGILSDASMELAQEQ